MKDEDCVLKHPHTRDHISRETIVKRLLDSKWDNRCVLCGKETDTGLSVCGICFFDKDFSIKKELKIVKKRRG